MFDSAATQPSPTGPLPDAILASTGLINHTFEPGYHPELSGASPSAIAVDNTSGDIFVAQAGSNTVSVLSPGFLTIKTIGVGSYPDAIVFDPAGGEVFVSNFYSDNVTVINASDLRVVDNIAVGAQSGYFASTPTDVIYDSLAGSVFVTQAGRYVIPCCSYNVTEINGRNNSIIRVVQTVGVPASGAFDPALDILAVRTGFGYETALINASTGANILTYSSENATLDVSIDTSDQIFALVTLGSSTTEEITLAHISSTGLSDFENYSLEVPYAGSGGFAYDPFTDTFLLSSALVNLIDIYPLNGSSTPIRNITQCLSSIFVEPSGDVLVGSACSNQIVALNSRTFAVEAAAVTGFGAGALFENPATHELLVADSTGDSIAVVNSSSFEYVGADTVGVTPLSAAYDPSTKVTYVLSDEDYENYNSYPDALLTPIPDATGAPGAPLTISASPLSVFESVTYDPYDGLLYAVGVTSPGSDFLTEESLAVINPMNNSLEQVLNVSTFSGSLSSGDFDQATVVPISPGLLLVSDPWQGAVLEVNASTGAVIWNTQLGGDPTELVLTSSLGLIFVENSATDSVEVLNLTGALEREVGVQGLETGIAYDSNNGRLYVASDYDRGGEVESFNATSQGGDPVLLVTSNLGAISYLADSGLVAVAGETTASIYFLGEELTTTSLGYAPAAVTQGTTMDIFTNVSGGYPLYSYNWSGLPVPCVSANRPALSCTPGYAGNFTVKVNVTDLAGEYSVESLEVNVQPYPLNVTLVASPPNTQPYVGSSINCSAILSSAEEQIVGSNSSFNWTVVPASAVKFNDTIESAVSVTFDQPGPVVLSVTVLWNGTSAQTSLRFDAIAAPEVSGGAHGVAQGPMLYLEIGAAVFAAVVVALLVRRRLRRTTAEGPELSH